MMNGEVLRMYLYMLRHKDKVVNTKWLNENTFRICITTSDIEPYDVEDFVFLYLTTRKAKR
jgi:hypothetical protein